ncbi:glycosyltransferase [Desulfomicrobium sp. ZS1]|uniref:glycosyltransferase n=1 Tax=Desulfomicrobium sp. ZS1 TaxID=2952228 RepID=UPI0020B421B6|nr:glycosyltransferase [Desulfomicrobium sp. ZS1]UTF49237.1 glycosyltransferase [Desulfomicrobium sp. ZS1]
MKSIQVVNVRWFNATAWYGMYLSRLLLENGHDVLVLGLPDTLSARKGQEWGLPMRLLDLNTTTPWGIAALYGKLKRLVAEFKPDVVNCHRGESYLLWGLLKKELGSFRLIRTRGDQRLPKANLVNRWLHNDVSDAVITTNSPMTRHFQNVFKVPPRKLHQILGGVDVDTFHPDPAARARIRAELGYGDNDLVVGLLGRFDRVKGQHELIRAVANLHGQGMSNIRLLLLGFDSATPETTVRGWIKEHGIESITAITGKRPDIPACLNALDLGVVASLWSETIARAALEIMATGVPLISTGVGVMPDLLEPEALFGAGDVDALAGRIREVMERPELADSLRREQCRRMYDLSGHDFLAKTLAVYEGVL